MQRLFKKELRNPSLKQGLYRQLLCLASHAITGTGLSLRSIRCHQHRNTGRYRRYATTAVDPRITSCGSNGESLA